MRTVHKKWFKGLKSNQLKGNEEISMPQWIAWHCKLCDLWNSYGRDYCKSCSGHRSQVMDKRQ